ncbi:UNVERIFIED_CONTAM: hypothetical protein RMT77_005485 [Armadillidium vulgare]|uniref:Uncharacterized protein n=1 Tax=Armadillidium nasatum TaxID=96803 RepID=A0A5N5SNA4_9CRUS|nr:hypothetical protein Anas_06199 [Armadillidium nasatum]RXG72275.1 hypothetical protein Avbf_00386 [Armadillidium vulgare]
MKLWGIAVFLLIVALTCEGEKGKEGKEGSDRKKKLLVAKYQTRTHVSLTTITSTAVLTCQLAPANSATCKKRRRKRATKALSIDNKDLFREDLNPSSETSFGNKDEKAVADPNSQREGRLKIVFWSTVTSQYTITTTSINSAMTFSLTFFCSVGGASYPPLCG